MPSVPIAILSLLCVALVLTCVGLLLRQRGQQARMGGLIRQVNELEALLGGMVEGVIAVDLDGKLVRMNRAAAAMLDVSAVEALGRSMSEMIGNAALLKLVEESLGQDTTLTREVTLARRGTNARDLGDQRYIHAEATVLRDAIGQRRGALVVLHDLTELRRLENVRRDFVANVSHEIRTPVTAIKGSVETLLDGQEHDPQDQQRFMAIIARQTDRLYAIVEDLLSLARLEQEEHSGTIDLDWARVYDVIASAVAACRLKAEARGIALTADCPTELEVRINPPLLEQAIVNLLDNAIKYSPDGKPVRLVVERAEQETRISVIDEGVGIAAEHLPRVFERFYRVDRARSRSLGGTGLGLAIVKHAAAAHGGRVSVQSNPGRGSTFTLHLPHNPAHV